MAGPSMTKREMTRLAGFRGSHPTETKAGRPANPRNILINLDGRSRIARRITDLAAEYVERLGGFDRISDVMLANIRRASELSAIAEAVRLRAICEGDLDVEAITRMETLAARATRALGLNDEGYVQRNARRKLLAAVPPPKPEDRLGDYLQAKYSSPVEASPPSPVIDPHPIPENAPASSPGRPVRLYPPRRARDMRRTDEAAE